MSELGKIILPKIGITFDGKELLSESRVILYSDAMAAGDIVHKINPKISDIEHVHVNELGRRSLHYGFVLRLDVSYKMGTFSNLQHIQPSIHNPSHPSL